MANPEQMERALKVLHIWAKNDCLGNTHVMELVEDALTGSGKFRGKTRKIPFPITKEMLESAEEAYMPFGDMQLAIESAILVGGMKA